MIRDLRLAYRLRWKRRRLLMRAWRNGTCPVGLTGVLVGFGIVLPFV